VKEEELFRAYGRPRWAADEPKPTAEVRGSATALDRFMDRISRVGGHWLWQGHRTRTGYGIFNPEGNQRVGAHRWAWMTWRGDLGDDVMLMNVCGRNDCVRPDEDHWIESSKAEVMTAVHQEREMTRSA
jgi:hypothetical protein